MSLGSRQQSELVELLQRECRGYSAGRTIAHLIDQGLISEPFSKAYVARRKVEEKVCRGVSKVAAMESVAEDMGCSFASVRNYIYHHYK